MHYKESLFDVKSQERWTTLLDDWMYPPGIAKSAMEESSPFEIEKIRSGAVFIPSAALEAVTTTRMLRALLPHAMNGALCCTASRLLHSIKKNIWNDDYELRMLDLIEHIDIMGICQIESMPKEEIKDLDRWIAVRGILPQKFTIMFGESNRELRSTLKAYGNRVFAPTTEIHP